MWRFSCISFSSLKETVKIFGSLILLTALLSCEISPAAEARLNAATQTVISQLQQDNFDAIYQNAGMNFHRQQSLADWRYWNGSVRKRWGSLQHAKIVRINRIAPFNEVYSVDTVMEYEHGNTNGRFLFNFNHQEPILISALLADPV